MSAIWLAAALLAVSPGEASTSVADTMAAPAPVEQEPLVPPRVGVELRDAARAALQRWARLGDKEADLAAREFLVLFKELERDDQLARSLRDPLRNKVRGRLLKLSEQIRKRIAVKKRLARSKQPKSVDAAAGGDGDLLGQFGGGGFGGRGGGGFGGQMMGGPGFGGAAQQRKDDYGEDLVEVIQATIAPHTWDVNGGPGTVYYWRPGRSIVVRQSGEVHNQLGGLLNQLQRAQQ